MSASRRRRRRRPLWESLLWLAGIIGTLAGWSELLTKPVTSYQSDHNAWRVFKDLVFGRGIYDGTLEGWAFLLLSAVIIVAIWYISVRTAATFNRYVETSRADTSMLETNVFINFVDPELVTAWIARSQVFHANAIDVGAYRYFNTLDHGHIDPKSFEISTTIDGQSWTESIIMDKLSEKGIEVTEVFRAPLPTSRLATYLADRTVLNMFRGWGWLRGVVAERNLSIKCINEYNGKTAQYQIEAARYRAARVRIWISFPLETAPDFKHIKVMRIRETAVHLIAPTYRPESARKVLYFAVNDVENERVRVTWRNKNLRRYIKQKEQQAALATQVAGAAPVPPAGPAPAAPPPPGPGPAAP